MPNKNGLKFVELMKRTISALKEIIAPGVGRLVDEVTKRPVVTMTTEAIAATDFHHTRPAITAALGVDGAEIVSVFGDSHPFDRRGSLALTKEMQKYFSSRSRPVLALFGTTGRPWAIDGVGQEVFDVNGAVMRTEGLRCIAQIVDQTAEAVEKWGCDTPSPDDSRLAAVIHVTSGNSVASVFGDDVGLEGQFDNKKLDPLLIRKIGEQRDLPENIAAIIRKEHPDVALNKIERQQLMYFAVEKELDFTDMRSDVRDILRGGIGDSAFVASGGGQSSWQGAINAVLQKPITALAGLRGSDNPKTLVEVKGVSGKTKEHRDFLDTSELLGYLAHEKITHPDANFFTLWEKYFNGNEARGGYPLSGIRWAYNPGNEDVARADEEKGGLNSKMSMVTNCAFVFGCLGGYRNLDPEKVDCKMLTMENELLPYGEAVARKLAPSFDNPYAGKYHEHGKPKSQVHATGAVVAATSQAAAVSRP